jgi:nucleotide-binding universal stress UspA family protein
MRVLYATDGSDDALAAAQLLTALPLDNASLLVLTVTEEGQPDRAEQALGATRDALRGCAAAIRTESRSGKPAVEILQAADEEAPDLIVLGSRGLGAVARFFLGSVAERVARHAACPVLIARRVPGEVRQVILGIDASQGAADAAGWLQRFPLPADCEVRIVTVLQPYQVGTYLDARLPGLAEELRAIQAAQREEAQTRLREVAQAFQLAGKRAVHELRERHPALGLIEAAEEHGADLVVVGRQGLSGIDRFLMGSVSEHVLHHAPCSVLIIPRRGAPGDGA